MKYLLSILFVICITLTFTDVYCWEAGEPSPVTILPDGRVVHGQGMCQVTVSVNTNKWMHGGYTIAVDGNHVAYGITPSNSVVSITIPSGEHYICLSDKKDNNHGGKTLNVRNGMKINLP